MHPRRPAVAFCGSSFPDPRGCGAFGGYLIIGLAATDQNRVAPCDLLPAPNGGVDIERVNLDAIRSPAYAFSSKQCGTGSHKGVEHDVVAPRGVLDCIGNQRDGLDRGMDGKIVQPALAEGVHARIGPHIGAVSAVPTELDVVQVSCITVLVNEDQFMLGTVEAALASV